MRSRRKSCVARALGLAPWADAPTLAVLRLPVPRTLELIRNRSSTDLDRIRGRRRRRKRRSKRRRIRRRSKRKSRRRTSPSGRAKSSPPSADPLPRQACLSRAPRPLPVPSRGAVPPCDEDENATSPGDFGPVPIPSRGAPPSPRGRANPPPPFTRCRPRPAKPPRPVARPPATWSSRRPRARAGAEAPEGDAKRAGRRAGAGAGRAERGRTGIGRRRRMRALTPAAGCLRRRFRSTFAPEAAETGRSRRKASRGGPAIVAVAAVAGPNEDGPVVGSAAERGRGCRP